MAPYIPVHNAPLQVRVPLIAASSPSVYMTMHVRDDCIGAIVGRGGKTIADIQQVEFVVYYICTILLINVIIYQSFYSPFIYSRVILNIGEWGSYQSI